MGIDLNSMLEEAYKQNMQAQKKAENKTNKNKVGFVSLAELICKDMDKNTDKYKGM